MIYDVIIIGAGPAGMTAGIYLARKKLKTLILSQNLGGQTAISGEVDNYPGLPDTNGIKLTELFKNHLSKFKDLVEVRLGQSVKTFSGQFPSFKVETSQSGHYLSKTIIIAAGSNYRHLNVPGEEEFARRGVSYCATCDAPLFSNKTVVVVGAGNAGLEAVVELNKIASKIYLITNQDKLTGDEIYQDQIKTYSKVDIIYDSTVSEITGQQLVEQIKLINLKTKEVSRLKTDGVFVEIGYEPATKFLPADLAMNERGEIKVNNFNETNIKGVLACGDVIDRLGKQTVIAAGEGARAAISVSQLLAKNV